MNVLETDLVRRVYAKLPQDIQVQVAAGLVSKQRAYEDTKAEAIRVLQSSEGKQLQRRMLVRKQHPRGVNADGMIYRNAPHLRTVAERLRCGCAECRGLLGEYGQGYKRFR